MAAITLGSPRHLATIDFDCSTSRGMSFEAIYSPKIKQILKYIHIQNVNHPSLSNGILTQAERKLSQDLSRIHHR